MCRQSGKASPIDYAGLAWCACRRTEARPLSAGRSRRAFLKSEGGSALRSWARSLCPGQMRKKTRRSRTFSQDPERNRIRKRHNTAPVRRKPFVLCGVDTERKGRVSRPLTCSRIFFSSLRGSGAVWDMGAGLLGEASTAGPRGLFAEREPAGVRGLGAGGAPAMIRLADQRNGSVSAIVPLMWFASHGRLWCSQCRWSK